MATYKGKRLTDGGPQPVYKDGAVLYPQPSQEAWNHSPDGFEWGYGGSGPAQLALALLLDVTGDRALSLRLHQTFKWERIAPLLDEWQLTTEEIKAWVCANRGNSHD